MPCLRKQQAAGARPGAIRHRFSEREVTFSEHFASELVGLSAIRRGAVCRSLSALLLRDGAGKVPWERGTCLCTRLHDFNLKIALHARLRSSLRLSFCFCFSY